MNLSHLHDPVLLWSEASKNPLPNYCGSKWATAQFEKPFFLIALTGKWGISFPAAAHARFAYAVEGLETAAEEADGSSIQKVLPFCGCEWNPTVPPMRSTALRTMVSPMPVPSKSAAG